MRLTAQGWVSLVKTCGLSAKHLPEGRLLLLFAQLGGDAAATAAAGPVDWSEQAAYMRARNVALDFPAFLSLLVHAAHERANPPAAAAPAHKESDRSIGYANDLLPTSTTASSLQPTRAHRR